MFLYGGTQMRQKGKVDFLVTIEIFSKRFFIIIVFQRKIEFFVTQLLGQREVL